MKQFKRTITIQCGSCDASGLYRGFMEAPGEAVVCVDCGGLGHVTLSGKPFIRRRKLRGITRIRWGTGLILDRPKPDDWFTYPEFERRLKKGQKKR